MIRELSQKSDDSEDEPGRWSMAITRHASGFRQIVVDNGALALTRLTPIGDGPADATNVTNLIKQEISSTLSYLTRLGYSPDEGLDVLVIAPEQLRGQFEGHGLAVRRIEVMTMEEAGDHLSISNVSDGGEEGEAGGEIGELLHAAWVAGKRNPALKLTQASWVKRQRQYLLRQTMLTGLSAGLALIFLYTAYGAIDWWRLSGDVSTETATRNILKSRLDKEARARGTEGMELRKIVIPLDIYKRFSAEAVDVLDALRPISQSLESKLRLRNIRWQIKDVQALLKGRARGASRRKRKVIQFYDISLTVDLNGFREPEKAMATTKSLVTRLQKRFPKQTVEVIRQPLGIEPSKSLSGSSNEGITRGTGSGWFADLRISGPVK